MKLVDILKMLGVDVDKNVDIQNDVDVADDSQSGTDQPDQADEPDEPDQPDRDEIIKELLDQLPEFDDDGLFKLDGVSNSNLKTYFSEINNIRQQEIDARKQKADTETITRAIDGYIKDNIKFADGFDYYDVSKLVNFSELKNDDDLLKNIEGIFNGLKETKPGLFESKVTTPLDEGFDPINSDNNPSGVLSESELIQLAYGTN